MRTGLLVLLLLAVLAVAFWGLEGIGIFFAAVLALVIAALLTAFLALWLVKRKVKREVRRLRDAFLGNAPRPMGQAGGPHVAYGPTASSGPRQGPSDAPRRDAIDVEPTRIRDERRPGP